MSDKSILLVEDDPDDEALAVRALSNGDAAKDIVVVRDGAEALDYLFATGNHSTRDPGQMPAVVLLDLKLPKVDGLEVLRRLRSDSRTRLVPVVVLTSSDERRDIVECYELGANSYVRKPIEFSRYSDELTRLAHYWLTINSPPRAK